MRVSNFESKNYMTPTSWDNLPLFLTIFPGYNYFKVMYSWSNLQGSFVSTHVAGQCWVNKQGQYHVAMWVLVWLGQIRDVLALFVGLMWGGCSIIYQKLPFMYHVFSTLRVVSNMQSLLLKYEILRNWWHKYIIPYCWWDSVFGEAIFGHK